MMNFSFHENISYPDVANNPEPLNKPNATTASEEFHLFAEKLRAPQFERYIPRPRLSELLKKSSGQIGATMIIGRAGTGKTTLAMDFAKNYERVAWYRVEATETDWNVFSRYLAESFNEDRLNYKDLPVDVAPFVENLFARLAVFGSRDPLLLVFDDIHYIFDTDWFPEFFNTLLFSHAPNIHLLFLSRCNPTLPLWRLRSKQVLSVIDEKLLAFNELETEELFKFNGVSTKNALKEQKKLFGRISKLQDLIAALKS